MKSGKPWNVFVILARWKNSCLAPEANLFDSETWSDDYAAATQWARQLSAAGAPVPAGGVERETWTEAAQSQLLPHLFCSASTALLGEAAGLAGPASVSDGAQQFLYILRYIYKTSGVSQNFPICPRFLYICKYIFI